MATISHATGGGGGGAGNTQPNTLSLTAFSVVGNDEAVVFGHLLSLPHFYGPAAVRQALDSISRTHPAVRDLFCLFVIKHTAGKKQRSGPSKARKRREVTILRSEVFVCKKGSLLSYAVLYT
jgi:hypothetical protein